MEERPKKKIKISQQHLDIGKTPFKGHKKAIDKQAELDFLKIRPGETHAQWDLRTRKLRIHPESEHEIKMLKTKKSNQKYYSSTLIVSRFEKENKEKEIIAGYTLLQSQHILKAKKRKGVAVYQGRRDPLFHFKYYFLIIRWAEVRYGVKRNDIDFLMHLYSLNRAFFKREFDEKSVVVPGVSFNQFVKKGYIESLKYANNRINFCKTGQSNAYNLTKKAENMILCIQRMLCGENMSIFYRINNDKKEILGKDAVDAMKQIYYDLRLEIKEMEQGFVAKDEFEPVKLNRYQMRQLSKEE